MKKKKKKILQNMKVEKNYQLKVEQLQQNKREKSSNCSKIKALEICKVEKLEGCHPYKKRNVKPSDLKMTEQTKKKEFVWKGNNLNKNNKEIPLVADKKIKFVNKKKS